jgi:peptide/nickel transport system substrate-binding protein
MQSCGCYQTDGNTITITMSRPFPDMPHWGASPAMSAIPWAVDPQRYRRRPLATGPYRVKRFQPARSLTLVRNGRWDPTTDPARTQYPDRYDFRTRVPLHTIDRLILADTGSGRTTMTREDVLPQDYRRFKDQAPERLVLGAAPCTHFVAPDYRAIPDIEVRRAIGYAYPYKSANLAAGYIEGVTAIPANNIMPPGVRGRTEYDPEPDLGDFSTDTAEAKRLLQESGNLGYEIKFLWRTDSALDTEVKDATVKSLTEAGFKVTAVPTTELGYVAARDDRDSEINLRTGGWCSDWNSGSAWLPPLLATTNLAEEGFMGNLAAFSEDAVDDRIDDILTLPLQEQASAWNDLDEHVTETYYPLITTLYSGVLQAHGSRISGHFADDVFGQPTWKNIHVIP